MNAEFFVLAFTAALNAKLLAIDLVLIENRRPRPMFACILAGAMGTAVGIGLIDVLVVHADAISGEKRPSAAVDLVLGVILLFAGGALFSGRLPVRRRAKENRLTRVLRQPRPLLAFGIGVLSGLPGGVYLTALHNLVAGHWSTATRVSAVFVFAFIEYLLIIVPWVLLEIWPDRTASQLRRAQSWLTGHVLQLTAWICLLLGAYLAIGGLVRIL
jgi:drug/metabolite transporter (DMT)-like permease